MNATLQRRVAFFQRQPDRRPLVFGHRGSPRKAPENTLASFRCALEEGADGVELDVRLSRDGQLVLSHDDLFRHPEFKGKTSSLRRLTLAEIQELPRKDGQRIPTLEEALLLKRDTDTALNIELKADHVAIGPLVQKTAALIDKWGGDKVILSSFSPFVLRRLRKRLPDVPSVLLFEKLPWWERLVFPLASLNLQGANPCEKILDQKLINNLQLRRGLIGAWTVNKTKRARKLAKLGVDILITDVPPKILSALENGPSHSS